MGLYLGYVRVSRVGDRSETLISPKLQERSIRQWAKSAGHDLEMLPPELDASGGDSQRPVLMGAVERIERGEAAGVAVWRFDRFTRSLGHSVLMLERIENVGGQLRSATEQLDPSTSAGRMTRNIMFSVAQNERENKAEGIQAAKADAIARGIYIAPYVPIGYRKRKDRRLEPDPKSAPVVREVFIRRAAGHSYHQLADYMRSELGRTIGFGTVRNLLKNPAYIGVSRQGKIRNNSAHEPLVDRATWEAAQASQPKPARGSTEALLRGLMFCTGCSMRMTTGLGRSARYYRCRKRHAAGRCPAPASIEALMIEPVIVELVLDRLEDLGGEASARDGAVSEAEVSLAAAERELVAFQELASVSEDGPEFFQAGMRSRIDAVNAARRHLASVKLSTPTLPDPATISELWPDLSVVERRQFLSGALGGIWVEQGRGIDRIAVVSPEHRPDRPRRGGPARQLVRVKLADIPGQIGTPRTEDAE